MTRPFLHQSDPHVETVVRTLSNSVASILLPVFMRDDDPDRTAVSTELAGALQDVLYALLKGNASLEVRRVLAKRVLPQLLVDDTLFGRPAGPGNYLIARRNTSPVGSRSGGYDVLEPDSDAFRPIEEATGAFPSFEAATSALVEHLHQANATLQEVKHAGIRVVPVAHVTARPEGFVVAERWYA